MPSPRRELPRVYRFPSPVFLTGFHNEASGRHDNDADLGGKAQLHVQGLPGIPRGVFGEAHGVFARPAVRRLRSVLPWVSSPGWSPWASSVRCSSLLSECMGATASL